MPNWLLPEHIEDLLPDEAWSVEMIRRAFLEQMHRFGYRLVVPPMLEYVDSLLIDGSRDMDLRTFKVMDQLTGRTLAVRADMTPQVARMDAHLLNQDCVTRLCYVGSVLHTQPAGLTSRRELLQAGAELFGHSGVESDLEIQQLLIQTLTSMGLRELRFDLGHVGVFRSLVTECGLNRSSEMQLFNALQGKDVTTLQAMTDGLDADLRDAILLLPQLYGDGNEVVQAARQRLPMTAEIGLALDQLQQAWTAIQNHGISCGVDLAELRGYHYHTGMVFSVYHQDTHDAIAQGGRYDDLGSCFGRSRPATGFSMDLRQIQELLPLNPSPQGILAPGSNDETLIEKIQQLRDQGERVIVVLSGDCGMEEQYQCDRRLVWQKDEWQVVPLN